MDRDSFRVSWLTTTMNEHSTKDQFGDQFLKLGIKEAKIVFRPPVVFNRICTPHAAAIAAYDVIQDSP